MRRIGDAEDVVRLVRVVDENSVAAAYGATIAPQRPPGEPESRAKVRAVRIVKPWRSKGAIAGDETLPGHEIELVAGIDQRPARKSRVETGDVIPVVHPS